MCLLAVPSWSETVYTLVSPLLYVTLISVFGAFLLRAETHPRGNEWNIWYRNRQWNRITAYLFFGIAVTPVTHESAVIEALHLLFTGLGIVSGYVSMIGFQRTKPGMAVTILGTVIGGGGFLVGFLTNQYTIAVGELIAAVPLAAWVLNTNKDGR